MLKVDSPYVVKFYEVYYDESYLHIVMDFIKSSCGDVFEMLQKETKLSEEKSRVIIMQCLRGLTYLHD